MTFRRTTRDECCALIGAALALSLLFQLVLGSAVGAAYAANKIQGFDRLGILCSTSDERSTLNGTAPDEAHHTKDASVCCSWGSRDAPSASHPLLPVPAFLDAYEAAAQGVVFVQISAVGHPSPRTLRQQAPRAPPILI